MVPPRVVQSRDYIWGSAQHGDNGGREGRGSLEEKYQIQFFIIREVILSLNLFCDLGLATMLALE